MPPGVRSSSEDEGEIIDDRKKKAVDQDDDSRTDSEISDNRAESNNSHDQYRNSSNSL